MTFFIDFSEQSVNFPWIRLAIYWHFLYNHNNHGLKGMMT